MKNVGALIASIVQLVFGMLAIAAFIILLVSGDSVVEWILTLLVAISLVFTGIVGIINYKKNK